MSCLSTGETSVLPASTLSLWCQATRSGVGWICCLRSGSLASSSGRRGVQAGCIYGTSSTLASGLALLSRSLLAGTHPPTVQPPRRSLACAPVSRHGHASTPIGNHQAAAGSAERKRHTGARGPVGAVQRGRGGRKGKPLVYWC